MGSCRTRVSSRHGVCGNIDITAVAYGVASFLPCVVSAMLTLSWSNALGRRFCQRYNKM